MSKWIKYPNPILAIKDEDSKLKKASHCLIWYNARLSN